MANLGFLRDIPKVIPKVKHSERSGQGGTVSLTKCLPSGSQEETLQHLITLHDLTGESKNGVSFVGLDDLNHFLIGDIMINRDSKGHSYSNYRGVTIGQFEDKENQFFFWIYLTEHIQDFHWCRHIPPTSQY